MSSRRQRSWKGYPDIVGLKTMSGELAAVSETRLTGTKDGMA